MYIAISFGFPEKLKFEPLVYSLCVSFPVGSVTFKIW